MKIDNNNDRPTSIQISNLILLPSGNFRITKDQRPFLIKNITDSNITVEIELPDSKEQYISTVLYPGWNPELIVGIKNVPSNSLQAGN